jgi:TetR/AcrR family transcriptional repressor of nem operon
MKGRNKIFDESDVINRAIEVFWSHGYESSSTEILLKAMGIGKGSFYNAFEGGKKELFEKAMEQFSSEALKKFNAILRTSDRPMDEIRVFFTGIASGNKKSHQLGCFLGNTITELSNVDRNLEARAVKLLKKLEHIFYTALKEAQKTGQIKSKTDPALLAHHLITLWNGLNITRRMYPDAEVLKPLIEFQLKMID